MMDPEFAVIPYDIIPEDDDGFQPNEYDIETFDALHALLARLHRHQDVTPLMEDVRFHFESAESLFRARRHVWERLGLKRSNAMLLGMMVDIGRYIERTSHGKKPRLCRFHESSKYLVDNFLGLQVEKIYLYCINHRGCLKERWLLHVGVDDAILFSLNKMLAEVVRANPAAVLVAHNHPHGTLRPSQDDIDRTIEMINALTVLNIPLMDHVIVAGHQAVSMRDNGFIPESYWMSQHPTNRFLRDWLLEEGATPKRPRKKKAPAKKE